MTRAHASFFRDKNCFGNCCKAWRRQYVQEYKNALIHPPFFFSLSLGGEEKTKTAAVAVEQRAPVRHRLTFHRNPLASGAGEFPRPPFGRFVGSAVSQRTASQQQSGARCNFAVSRASGAFTLGRHAQCACATALHAVAAAAAEPHLPRASASVLPRFEPLSA